MRPAEVMADVSKVWLDFAGRTLLTQTFFGPCTAPILSAIMLKLLKPPGLTRQHNYYTTETRYDAAGLAYYSSDADGTITLTKFDGLGRPTSAPAATRPN